MAVYTLVVAQDVLKDLGDAKKYPSKVSRQILLRIVVLGSDPYPADCKKVGEGYRVDSGEYRIYYEVDEARRHIDVLIVDKRNDDQVYKRLKRQ
ncbi:MAG: type II toxin-antitoxin system RelE/ParE family toxin [Chloroflexi bacterium]|nr:type II toxin-antitoxin system RelE/ParE family toxin [Chloroflexota bacterium]